MQVAKARPDGYTLLINHIGLSAVPALYKKLNFDRLAAYEFVGLFAEVPMVIMTRKAFPARNYAELGAYARSHKDKFTDAICDLPTTTSSQIRSGELRACLPTAPQRMASLPDVPTATELGVPSLAIGVWFGIYAPAAPPEALRAKLASQIAPWTSGLTRPLGATVGDLLDKPAAQGGFAFGRPIASVIILVAIVVLVAVLPIAALRHIIRCR